MPYFNTESGVSMFDGKPSVLVELGDTHVRVRPMKAREMGLMLIEAAIEAERDAAVVDFMMEGRKGKKAREEAAKILFAIRDHRQQYDGLE